MRGVAHFFIHGLIWLFLFSIPVGHHGKRFFHVGYYYIVDTKLVHLVTDILSTSAKKTENTASDVVNDVVNKADQSSPLR